MKTKKLCLYAVVVAIYIVCTIINPIGYGVLQFRVSAVLSVLPFTKPNFKLPLIVAVALANMYSPLGIIDVLAGVLLWTAAYYVVDRFKVHLIVKLILTAVLSAFVVGGELTLVTHAPFVVTSVSIFVSQSIAFAIGYLLKPVFERLPLNG